MRQNSLFRFPGASGWGGATEDMRVLTEGNAIVSIQALQVGIAQHVGVLHQEPRLMHHQNREPPSCHAGISTTWHVYRGSGSGRRLRVRAPSPPAASAPPSLDGLGIPHTLGEGIDRVDQGVELGLELGQHPLRPRCNTRIISAEVFTQDASSPPDISCKYIEAPCHNITTKGFVPHPWHDVRRLACRIEPQFPFQVAFSLSGGLIRPQGGDTLQYQVFRAGRKKKG